MNTFKKLAAVAVALTMSAGALQAGDVLDKVMADGVLRISTDPAWPPQSFLDENNEMDGFDVDVARAIAAKLGVEAAFVTPDWSLITAGNWAGRWDISVGSMTPTKERAEVLSFPAIYYYVPASVAVHNDSDAQAHSDLNGRTIGVSAASTWEQYLRHDLVIDAVGVPEFDYEIDPGEIKTYGTDIPVIDELRLGDGVRINAMIGSLPNFLDAIKNGYPIRVLGEPLFFEPLAVAVDLGDEEFSAKVGEIVEALREDGTLAELSEKWYDFDFANTN
ncbi:transporter substrate-binding domain-containing protein [Aliiroseovarius subalbicans]|uniref:transporter substrate-binding domain-containing protein n=1 Tax=Aliiroseovarius subalbicans TaxID=2925840 RepID=UPI001F58104D|nr:transporter substrate-binding domain-containing protein [Aliiroseovarius subalbicans]MCI2397856.1 transporter substrate-binding domain-containing protein [Aliiroseovarius subalbicans]